MSDPMSDPMSDQESGQEGLRSRGSDAVTELANALLDNPLFEQALSTALGMGEKAAQAQKRAMDAVGLPSADQVARLERRLRSLSNRLEAVEDQLDRVSDEIAALRHSAERAPEAEAGETSETRR
jgi:predicted  nucleic acid-binding Zn-ribbon protein